jgi:hypothetical protein
MQKELVKVFGTLNGKKVEIELMATSPLQAMRLAREQNEGFVPTTAMRSRFFKSEVK